MPGLEIWAASLRTETQTGGIDSDRTMFGRLVRRGTFLGNVHERCRALRLQCPRSGVTSFDLICIYVALVIGQVGSFMIFSLSFLTFMSKETQGRASGRKTAPGSSFLHCCSLYLRFYQEPPLAREASKLMAHRRPSHIPIICWT